MIDKEKLSKFYFNYRFYIFPAVVTLSSLILIVLIIYPQIIQLIKGTRLQEDFKNKSKFLEAKAQTLENYTGEDLSRKVSVALNAYPAEKDFATSLTLLQNLFSQSGFGITTLGGGQGGIDQSKNQSYAVKIEATGPRTFLSSLISNIENSSRIMRINSIDITAGGRQADAITVNLVVEVLYSPVPNTFGAIDTPLPELSQKDEDLIAKLSAVSPVVVSSQPVTLGPRGKPNPFE